GAHERDGGDEARKLVHGIERLLHRGEARHAGVVAVRLDRTDDRAGDAGLLEDRLPVLRVPARVALVIEVVEQSGDAPHLLVLAELRGVVPHRRLDRETVLAEAVALGVFAQERPGFVARHERLPSSVSTPNARLLT